MTPTDPLAALEAAAKARPWWRDDGWSHDGERYTVETCDGCAAHRPKGSTETPHKADIGCVYLDLDSALRALVEETRDNLLSVYQRGVAVIEPDKAADQWLSRASAAISEGT